MTDSKTQEEKDYEKLSRLSNHAFNQCKSVGFYDSAGNAPESGRGKTISEKINAPDTWTSKAADDQAEYTKKEVDALVAVFTGIHATLKAEAAAKKPQ